MAETEQQLTITLDPECLSPKWVVDLNNNIICYRKKQIIEEGYDSHIQSGTDIWGTVSFPDSTPIKSEMKVEFIGTVYKPVDVFGASVNFVGANFYKETIKIFPEGEKFTFRFRLPEDLSTSIGKGCGVYHHGISYTLEAQAGELKGSMNVDLSRKYGLLQFEEREDFLEYKEAWFKKSQILVRISLYNNLVHSEAPWNTDLTTEFLVNAKIHNNSKEIVDIIKVKLSGNTPRTQKFKMNVKPGAIKEKTFIYKVKPTTDLLGTQTSLRTSNLQKSHALKIYLPQDKKNVLEFPVMVCHASELLENIYEDKDLQEPMAKQGYMTKEGGSNKNWKKRIFTLNTESLSYAKNEKSRAIYEISLSHIADVSPKTRSAEETKFVVSTFDRDFLIDSGNPTRATEWIEAIRYAVIWFRSKGAGNTKLVETETETTEQQTAAKRERATLVQNHELYRDVATIGGIQS